MRTANVYSIKKHREDLERRKRLKKATQARPFHTYYYGSDTRDEEAYRAQGHPATERGAIRGAVVRVFMGEHFMARVYDQDGTLIFTIRPGANNSGIKINYGRSGA